MAKKIVMRTGEALVEADEAWSAAEPEVVIGELDGPVGYAIANLIGDSDGVASGVDDPPGGVPAIALGLRVANLQRALAARLEKAARKFSS